MTKVKPINLSKKMPQTEGLHYISNLSFDGLYINQSLVDKCQVVDGVEIAELQQASSRYGVQVNYRPINARSRPYAGYYQVTDQNLILNFIANE